MAAAFAQHKIFFPRDAVERGLDALDERFIVRAGEIFARESRFDGDGTHVHQRTIKMIHRVHQHGILVDFLLLDFHEALADRLDVTDARKMFLQRRDEAKRNRGLAVVLARGGDENARRRSVHERQNEECGMKNENKTAGCNNSSFFILHSSFFIGFILPANACPRPDTISNNPSPAPRQSPRRQECRARSTRAKRRRPGG